MARNFDGLYIGGRWVDSKGGKPHDVINPATEEAASTIVLGTAADVDRGGQQARPFQRYPQMALQPRAYQTT